MAGPVRIAILANASQARREINGVAGDASSMGSKIGKYAKVGGAVFAAGLGVAGAAAIRFGRRAVDSASAAQQSYGATESVFGKSADKIIRHSTRAADAVGLSANEYRESANLIGALFKNQGVQADQLAGKTNRMVKVGADLAATYGGTTREAVEALSSAFKGEFDPLERYGVSLKQSTINAELAARGEDKLTGAALRAAQQRATTALITRQAGSAIGAFGRENDTLAGQQQRSAAAAENLRAKIGSALLPALTAVYRVVNSSVLPAVSELADKYAPKLGAELGRVATSAGPKLAATLGKIPEVIASLRGGGGAGGELKQLGANIGALATGAKQASASLPSFTDALQVGNTVIAFAADHTDLLAKALPVLAVAYAGLKASQLAANVVQTLSLPTKIAEVVVNRQLVASNRALIATRAGVTGATVANTAAETVNTGSRVGSLAGLVAQKVALVATSVATKAAAAAQWVLNAAMLANPVGLVIAAIVALVAVFVIAWKKSETFRNIVTGAWNAIKAATAAVWGAVKAVVVGVFNTLKNVFTNFTGPGLIIKHWNTIKTKTSEIWQAVVGVVRDKVAALVGWVRGIKDRVTSIFSKAGGWLLDAGKRIIRGLLDGIQSMIGKVRSKLSELTNLIPDWKGPAPKDARLLRPAGRAIIGGLLDGFADQKPKVRQMLGALSREISTFSASPRAELTVSAQSAYASSRQNQRLEVAVKLTSDQLSQLQRGRQISLDLAAFQGLDNGLVR